MTPYYSDDLVTIYHGDCRGVLADLEGVVVTDPPFNVGYHYDSYNDKLPEHEYLDLMRAALRLPSAVIHYPEDIFRIATAIGAHPTKCASWVYHANTPKQWRMVAWFGVDPDFKQVRQPYKNPSDKRIQALRAAGSEGSALYDWWQVDQVKNVSGAKVDHPCQMPLGVMRNIVGVTPSEVVIDPFMGSGSTLRAAKDLGRKAVGIELSERYCEQAARRMGQEALAI